MIRVEGQLNFLQFWPPTRRIRNYVGQSSLYLLILSPVCHENDDISTSKEKMIRGKLDNKIWLCFGALTLSSRPDLRADPPPKRIRHKLNFYFLKAEFLPRIFREPTAWKHSGFFVFSWKFRATSSHILFVFPNEWCIIHSLVNEQDITIQTLCAAHSSPSMWTPKMSYKLPC